jgi:hypothetical protein
MRGSEVTININHADESAQDTPKPPKRQIGFAKGAEIPKSFFEPLTEEELQEWGL